MCIQISWYDSTTDPDHKREKLHTAIAYINLQRKN